MFEITDLQKIGLGLTTFGVVFLLLGVLLFFDGGLLAIGNVSPFIMNDDKNTMTRRFLFQLLFLGGLTCFIGPDKVVAFFFKKEKTKATGCFLGGIFIVLVGSPIIGMLIEGYGFYLLFEGLFPQAINFLRQIPVVNVILALPGIHSVACYLAGETQQKQN